MWDRQFFIVGAQRSGTTYLARVLDAHPEIEMAMPLAPEPKYFLRDDFPRLRPGDYLARCYGRKPGASRRGEKGTSYLERTEAARRIAAWFPRTQLIFILRHPADRAVSNYHFSRHHGFETLPMAEAFTPEMDRRDFDRRRTSVSPFAYLRRGRYIDDLRAYGQVFAPEQLIVLIYEGLVGALAPIQQLYRTLGVADDFVPHPVIDQRVNPGAGHAPPLDPELGQFLNDHYADSIAELEAHLGRTIPAWDRSAVGCLEAAAR
jgi:hypothetical protein